MLGKVDIIVEGVNFSRFINELKQNYFITNIKRVHNTATKLTVPTIYYAKIIAYLQDRCYNIKVIQFSPLLKLNLFCKRYFGHIVLLTLCVLILCTLSNFVWGINFVKDGQYNSQIKDIISDCNVISKWTGSVDCDKLELAVLDKLEDIGLINITICGCYLVVDYTISTLPSDVMPVHGGPILATQSGLISRLFVTQGTPLVEVNSYVTVGQPIIANYFIDKDGNTIPCEPKGKAYVYCWKESTVKFCEDSIQYVPTGEEIVCTAMQFLNSQIVCHTQNMPYQNYLTEQETIYLTKLGLPIKLIKTHYVQTQPTLIHSNFDDNLDLLKMQAKENVLGTIEEQNILEEKYTISHVGDVYFVSYYAKSENLVT
ncbi:MAG: sporulation protein YqfD [Clostridia bacterium]|nr:sporulation protein YqfD [Clostridia bacterium]